MSRRRWRCRTASRPPVHLDWVNGPLLAASDGGPNPPSLAHRAVRRRLAGRPTSQSAPVGAAFRVTTAGRGEVRRP